MFATRPSSRFALLALGLSLSLGDANARDVYGNNTPWTNNDTIIWELQRKRALQENNPGNGGVISWQEQLRRQKEERDQERAWAEEQARRKARGLDQGDAQAKPKPSGPPQPIT